MTDYLAFCFQYFAGNLGGGILGESPMLTPQTKHQIGQFAQLASPSSRRFKIVVVVYANSGNGMRILTLIALAISLLVCSACAWAQSSNTRPESSSTVSTSTADFAD